MYLEDQTKYTKRGRLRKESTKFTKGSKFAYRKGNVPSIIEDLLIGTLLGDCYGEKGKKAKTPIFRFKQSCKHEPYIFYLYFILLHWGNTSTNPLNLRPTKDRKGNTHYLFGFNTLAVPELSFIYDLFYSKGKKFISQNLKDFINARALAFWISDDGSLLEMVYYFIQILFPKNK